MMGVGSTALAVPACGKEYVAQRDTLKGGWRVRGIYRGDNKTVLEKLNGVEWHNCLCDNASAACTCCEVDVAKTCAEITRVYETTKSRLNVPVCKGTKS
jgi:hypothetical protein